MPCEDIFPITHSDFHPDPDTIRILKPDLDKCYCLWDAVCIRSAGQGEGRRPVVSCLEEIVWDE